MANLPDDVAGFPRCGQCPYRVGGTPRLCFRCASRSLTPVSDDRCDICCQDVITGFECGNSLCHSSDRQFKKCRAIAMKRGDIDRLIKGYKYEWWDGSRAWATMFARLLVGYLDRHAAEDSDPLIVAAPTFVGPGSSTLFRHTEEVVRRAWDEDVRERWRFDDMDDPVIVKTGPTPASAGATKTVAHAQAVARELRSVLRVTQPRAVLGQHVIVYDDVFTTGHTLNEVARALRDAGARSVIGLVLARQPWG